MENKHRPFVLRAIPLVLSSVLLLAASGFAAPVPDTGQTMCYDDAGNVITCPNPGQPFFGQDANYTINPQSYTKLDSDGISLPDSATSWAMVRDNVTGLIWEAKTDEVGIHNKDNSYLWQGAQDIFIKALNHAAFGGYSDWRLPTLEEMATVVNQSCLLPTINTTYFPNTVSSHYWSSNTLVFYTSSAWTVTFERGQASWDGKSSEHYVRAVRGGHSGSFGLVINGDGTVTDTSSGLMWQQSPGSQKKWEEALSYCESLSLAGYTDWRLPTNKELRSIVDYSRNSPATNTIYFPNTRTSAYWSSTSAEYDTRGSWGVSFSAGQDKWRDRLQSSFVRAVRGGQNQLSGHLIILAPLQGSALRVGTPLPISWETQGISDNVKISISREGGKPDTFETITASTENDGAYTWTVINPSSCNCMLKIEPINDTQKGTTQGLFTIYDAPTATTGTTTAITSDSATLNGAVNPKGVSTTVIFEYGTSTSYGSTITTTQSPLTGAVEQSVSADISSLTPVTTYHYRVKATNSAGTSYGEDKIFINAFPPTVTTAAATTIKANTAESGGDVTWDGYDPDTARGVCWSTSENPTIADAKTTDGIGTGPFTSSITGLIPGTTYHARAYATNIVDTAYGRDVSFTSLAEAPTASTNSATSTTSNSATLNGAVNPNGASTTVIFDYGIDTNYGSTVTAVQSPLTGSTAQSVSADIAGLTPGVTYHFRANSSNIVGEAYGEDQTFTTSAKPPTAATGAATAIESGSATLNGNVNPNGDTTSVAFEYGTTISYGSLVTASQSPLSGSAIQPVSAVISGLSGGTALHYRVKATNSLGTALGSDQTFNIPIVSPEAKTGVAESMTSTGVILKGAVNPKGIATIYYFEYGATTGYGFITGQKIAGSGWEDIPVSVNVAGLSPNTNYHFRMVATSTAGTDEGDDSSFKTRAALPTVTTNAVSGITETTASCGGIISSNGGAMVTAKGVCWGHSPNPTTNNNHTSDGTGIGIFASSITGLSPGTTYHVRAYATNSAGKTGYGNNLTFETSQALSFLYVSSDGDCGTKEPCYRKIQDAIDAAEAESVILVKNGTYEESLNLGTPKSILVKGGYDSAEYDQQTGNGTFIRPIGLGTIKASQGSLRFEMISIKPGQ